MLGAERAAAPERYGPFAGLIATREHYAVALSKSSALRAPVNTALRALQPTSRSRLQKRWLSADMSKLRALR